MTHDDLVAAYLDEAAAEDTARFSAAVRSRHINQAMQRLCRLYDLPYNEVTTTIAGLTGAESLTLPAGWKRPIVLSYLTAEGGRVVLNWKTGRDELDTLYPPDTTDDGDPVACAVWAGALLVRPALGRDITFDVDFYQVLPFLTGASSNRFTEQAPDVILYSALEWYASSYLLEDPRIATWQATAAGLRKELARLGWAQNDGARPVMSEF